jgi:glycogen(starch) synthase
MRIWLAPSAFFPHRGGVEELSVQLARELGRGGADVLIVTHRHPLELAESETLEGIRVRRVSFTAPRVDPRALPPFLRDTKAIQRTLDEIVPMPDVIHVQCVSNQVAHLLLYGRRHDVPVVVSTQGEVMMDAGAIFARSAYMRLTLRASARRARALTACSAWAATETARLAPRFADATVVPNGVDPAQWDVGPLTSKPVVCAWGRHVPQKGFDLAIDAFSVLRDRIADARLVIGGDGPETPRLRTLAGPGVDFIGPLDRDGVRRLLAASRIALVPSRIEPFGIVALEALAAGRGLVYATGTGIDEASGGLGRSADPRDARALADALEKELAVPTPVEAGKARGVELSWGRVAEHYRQIYDALLSDGDR